MVLYETAAICLHLADTHPESGMAPLLATPERAAFYKWLVWLSNTLQTALIVYFYPERWVDAGNESGARQVQAHAESKIASLLEQLEAQLQQSDVTCGIRPVEAVAAGGAVHGAGPLCVHAVPLDPGLCEAGADMAAARCLSAADAGAAGRAAHDRHRGTGRAPGLTGPRGLLASWPWAGRVAFWHSVGLGIVCDEPGCGPTMHRGQGTAGGLVLGCEGLYLRAAFRFRLVLFVCAFRLHFRRP